MGLSNLFRKGKNTQFEEIEEYRDLLEVPKHFEEGFNSKTILGALFVSIIMVPGNIYLELMIGGSIGAAAQWVTIILFLELAKRSFTVLKRQELYLLYYVTSALVTRETNAFEGLLWHQYFVQSPAAKQFGISKLIPYWWAPSPDSEALIERTFFHEDWIWPISILVLGFIMARIAWFTASYVLFRLTSDYEKLPFPFAPIAAQGAMALAEESSGEYTWKWRVFSIGAVIGVVWGALYVAVPAITGAFMEQPIQLIPIPWVDFTQYTGYFLPATPLGFTLHLGPIF
ncbi:MAG: peptide transporter, partial [bacterium]|nr:peptide transporter [bacterium]